MKTHLVVYRSYVKGRNQLAGFLSHVRRSGERKQWSGTHKFAVGDLVLFYFGKPAMSIVALGKVASRFHPGVFEFDETKRGFFGNYKPVWLLENPIRLPDIVGRIGLQDWYSASPYRRSHELEPHIAQTLLGEISRLNPSIGKTLKDLGVEVSIPKTQSDSQGSFLEGGIQEVTRELRKRNDQLRVQAIAEYGYRCQICGFDFEEFYGDLGTGYVEVHHVRPLSEYKHERLATLRDVAVVCANCHRVLHRHGKDPIPLRELRKAIHERIRTRLKGVSKHTHATTTARARGKDNGQNRIKRTNPRARVR